MGRRDRLSLVIGAVVIALSIFAIGGATRLSQALIALATAALVASTLLSRRQLERWPPLLILLAAASAWTFVQWLPMPAGLVEALTPTLESLRADGTTLAGVDGTSRFSMDPPSTMRALTFFLTLSGVAIVALRQSISEQGRYVLLASVAAGCGLAALTTGIHELVGAGSLYGLYEPRHGEPLLMGPLLNTNHLGCLMALSVSLSAGLFMYQKQTAARRALWALNGVGCLVVTAATLSRGAIIGLAAGFLVVLFALLAQRLQSSQGSRRRKERFLSTTMPVGVMVACGLVVAVYLGAGSVMQQIENTSLDELHGTTSKFSAWKSTVTLIEESPWVGIGRGAFESTFTRVHPASAFATFSNPENEGLQAIVEWGIPAALVLGALAAWTLLLGLRRWNDGPLAAGALGAMVVVLFQSNFDFGLELLGLALPVTVVLSTLSYVPLREMSSAISKRVQIGRVAHALVIVLGAPLADGAHAGPRRGSRWPPRQGDGCRDPRHDREAPARLLRLCTAEQGAARKQ